MLHQATGCRGNDDLSTVGRVADASGSMHVHAHVMRTAGDTFTRVDTHADAHQGTFGPFVGLKASLSHHGRLHCAVRSREGGEKGVAGRVDLHATSRLNGAADDDGVVAANLRVGVAEGLQ